MKRIALYLFGLLIAFSSFAQDQPYRSTWITDTSFQHSATYSVYLPENFQSDNRYSVAYISNIAPEQQKDYRPLLDTLNNFHFQKPVVFIFIPPITKISTGNKPSISKDLEMIRSKYKILSTPNDQLFFSFRDDSEIAFPPIQNVFFTDYFLFSPVQIARRLEQNKTPEKNFIIAYSTEESALKIRKYKRFIKNLNNNNYHPVVYEYEGNVSDDNFKKALKFQLINRFGWK